MAYWGIFFDLDKPEKRICFVPVKAKNATIKEAADAAWELGCNPGGACGGNPLPQGYIPAPGVVGRLLSQDEAEAALEVMAVCERGGAGEGEDL